MPTENRPPVGLRPEIARETMEAAIQALGQIWRAPSERSAVDAPPATAKGISGVIGFDGDVAFRLVLGVPEEAVRPLTVKFTGVPIGCESEMVEDVVGEITNVIAGSVVARLHLKNVDIRMSLPSASRSLRIGEITAGAAPASCVQLKAGDVVCYISLTATGNDGPGRSA